MVPAGGARQLEADVKRIAQLARRIQPDIVKVKDIAQQMRSKANAIQSPEADPKFRIDADQVLVHANNLVTAMAYLESELREFRYT